jgi:hypothetical protein
MSWDRVQGSILTDWQPGDRFIVREGFLPTTSWQSSWSVPPTDDETKVALQAGWKGTVVAFHKENTDDLRVDFDGQPVFRTTYRNGWGSSVGIYKYFERLTTLRCAICDEEHEAVDYLCEDCRG